MHYKRMKQELEQARADIIHAGPVKDLSCIRGSGISNPTEAKAIRLADNPYLKHHERTCKAIERALKLGGEPAQEFFNYKYLSRGNWQNSQDIHIGQSTFFRRRKILIRQVAEQMGLIQP
jgi:RinA family phage transcriptional activator